MDLKGKRIRLIAMPDDPAPIPEGTEGTVEWVTRMLCVPPDQFEVVE